MGNSMSNNLLKALDKINRPGTFCASGELPSILPGLEVSGLGQVALPLDSRQAKALIKQARQAPYGKGTETVVDTRVRRVWEIDAEQLTFANPEWPNIVQEAVEAVEAALGLTKRQLQAHLYKLLVYEMGGFFLPHRDGEKLDRMVATLVIGLPSAHEGGELIVRHEGREVTINFSEKSRFQTQFAAFYADCEHEVLPVTSGFRLAITYNLTLMEGQRGMGAPTSGEHIAAITELLRKWVPTKKTAKKDQSPPPKLAVLLDHKYSQDGLSRDMLKGIDSAQADVLFTAAREAGCDAYLALITYLESGLGEPAGGYDYGRRGRYRWDEDDDDDGRGDYIMQEVYDHSLQAEHFSDPEGNSLAFGAIPFSEEEIVADTAFNERDADEQDFEGYTGNAGMTLTRWYHRAAVVLWPEYARFDVLCGAGVRASVGGLAQMVRRWKNAKKSESDALRAPCLAFAERIIALWPEQSVYGYRARTLVWDAYDEDFDDMACDADATSNDARGPSPGQSLLMLLETLDDVPLVSKWIRNVLARDTSVQPGVALGRCCERHGWLTFQKELQGLFGKTSDATLERHAALLANFALRADKNGERIALCGDLAAHLLTFVEGWDPSRAKKDSRLQKVDAPRLLVSLTQTTLTLDEPPLLARLVAYVLARPGEFDLTTVQVPVWITLEPWLRRNVKSPVVPLRHWLAAIVEALEARTAQPPQEPTDWRRGSQISCKCADCKVLAAFLNDPEKAVLRLPLAQARRSHLHETVKYRALDTTYVTERKGRPFTLVFKKTKDSYKRALAAHHLDLDHLAKMHALLRWYDSLKADRAQAVSRKTKPKTKAKAKPGAKKA